MIANYKVFAIFSIIIYSVLSTSVCGEDICKLLRRQDCNISVDNNMVYYMRTRKIKINLGEGAFEDYQPGIVGAWYKSPKLKLKYGQGRQEKSALIYLTIDNQDVKLIPLKNKIYWAPDHTHQEFIQEDSNLRLIQDTCIWNDIVICKIKISGISGKQGAIKILGKSMGPGKAWVNENIIGIAIEKGGHKDYTEYIATNLKNCKYMFKDQEVKYIGNQTKFTISSEFGGAKNDLSFAIVLGMSRNKNIVKHLVKKIITNPKEYFNKVFRKWSLYFNKAMPSFDCPDIVLKKFYYWVFYVLKADTYNIPEKKFTYIAPSKYSNWLKLAWDEDTAHIITGAIWFNDPVKLEMLKNMIYYFQRYKAPYNYGLITMAAWELYKRTGDRKFLEKSFLNIISRTKSIQKKEKKNLVQQNSSYLIGWDNSTRFCWGGFNKRNKLRRFARQIYSIDLNSFLARQYEITEKMAMILGEKTVATNAHANRLATSKAINKYMWDEATGFYYDVFADNYDKLYCKTCCGFYPLIAGISSTEQFNLLYKHLMNPSEFNTKYSIPCISYDYKERGKKWSGDVCGRNNWLLDQALIRYSPKAAAYFTYKTLELFTQNGNPRALGYQDPDKGGSAPPLFITEISGALDMFIRRIIGFIPESGKAFKLYPIGLKKEWAYMQWGPFYYKGKNIEIRWDKPDGVDKFQDGKEGYSLIIDGKIVFTSQSIPINKIFIFVNNETVLEKK